MRDAEIRQALRDRLTAEHHGDPNTLIRQELGLCLGETRVDVAVLNGSISGFEIKSARDTLERLPHQVALYGRVLDFATIVTCGRYADRVYDFVPTWWGVMLADAAGSGVALSNLRAARANPSVDAYCVAQLLWRDEAFDVLRARNLHRGLTKATRFQLWGELVEELTLPELKDEVRERIKARQSWPGGQ